MYISHDPGAAEHDLPPAGALRLAESHRLRVLIADENRLSAEALMFMLESDPTVEAIGYSLDGRNALELVAAFEPDAVLVGSDLAGMSQLKLCQLMGQLDPHVLVLTLHRRLVPIEIEALYGAGASACVPLSCSADELLHELAAARERLKRRTSTQPARQLVRDRAVGA